MVGNKAQKAVAAALTGVLAFGGVAPAFAGVWSGDPDASWFRVDGSHKETYQMGTYDDDDDNKKAESGKSGAISGTRLVRGRDRYDTAFDAINYNAGFGEDEKNLYAGADCIVLASGTSQADALVAAGVAGMLAKGSEKTTTTDGQTEPTITSFDVPVMITPSDGLNTQAFRAVQWKLDDYLDADDKNKESNFTVYLVGGEAALSEQVEEDLEDISEDMEIVRIDGKDRTDTSLKAVKTVGEHWLEDDDKTSTVFVAGGWSWADALSVSSEAYRAGEPILLTGSDGRLTSDQVDYLKDADDAHVTIAVIGGPATPSAKQLTDEEGFDRAKVDTLSGKDRYGTSAAVIEWLSGRIGDEVGTDIAIAVASGNDAHWADALIGGPFVGANDGVIALVDGVEEVTALKEAYKLRKDAADDEDEVTAPEDASYIIGGEASIDAKFAKKLNKEFPVDTPS